MEFPVPTEDTVNQAMLDAWRTRGEFLLQHCARCGQSTYYPRKRCPSCWSAELTDVPSAGGGEIVTFSIVHRGVEEAFRQLGTTVTLAVVKTDEGPQVITRIVGDGIEQTEIGRRVRLYSGIDRASYPLPVYSLEPVEGIAAA